MNHRSSAQVRQEFIDFFADKGHAFVPSAPLPAVGDPTLLFVNSGMVPFKDIFLGTAEPAHPRVCNTQKCLRVSGKHNDLEEVGRDTYHQTFFEMLGFWSFGDYFKRDAIKWLWELLTDVWGLPPDRLYATVFAGDEEDGLGPDTEAADLWAEVTDIDPSHIQMWGKKDNFWEMAETGPCGPCSEVTIDLTPEGGRGDLVNGSDPRVIELGNIVFMQYNRDSSGRLTPLARKHVDFGGGFERMTAALNGSWSNYDTDLFTTIFDAVRELSGSKAYAGSMDDRTDVAYRVVADHLRCLTFAITDGVLPSNTGAGYVLRRILRRAVRHGREHLSLGEPFLWKLSDVVVELMGGAFPELTRDPQAVSAVLKEEEESFARTLDRGIELFHQAEARVRDAGQDQIPGEDAFKLHDTYGFPLDLTQVMADEAGLSVDVARFDELMEEARELARSAAGATGVVAVLADAVHYHSPEPTVFTGYDSLREEVEAEPLVVDLGDETVAVVLPRTPFYAESGGQVGDTGTIEGASGAVMKVTDTQKVGDVWFHIGTVERGDIRSRDTFVLAVDRERREAILPNHTGTHMMNLGFRLVLGPHVEQKGSLVAPDRLRFDLSHTKPVSADEMEAVEKRVNADIDRDLVVYDGVVPLETARGIRNLRAVFGEKYPPEVRVVSIGVPVEELVARPDNEQWDDVSIELCGGTHLGKTGEAAAFVFVAEEAVAKGVRRVVALTGRPAAESRDRGAALMSRLSALDGGTPDAREVSALLEELKDETLPAVVRTRVREGLAEHQRALREASKKAQAEAAGGLVDEVLALASSSEGPVATGRVGLGDASVLRKAVEEARGRGLDKALFVASESGAVVAFVPASMSDRGLAAGTWVKEAAGRGGGKPDLAQGSAAGADLDSVLEKAASYAAQHIAD